MSVAKKIQVVNPERSSKKAHDSVDRLAQYFYRIANHEELFKIGKGFLNDVNKGVKNFAFTSTGYKNSQQKSILGLCCFFDHNADYKIVIISDQLAHGFFSELVSDSAEEHFDLSDGEGSLRYKSFHHHFDFIEYSDLMKYYEQHVYTKKFEHELKNILDKYDVIFWDIPEMEHLKKNPHFHYRISSFYESMTVIVAEKATSGKQIETIKSFFSNFNINLNGVLFDSSFDLKSEKSPRKKFLGIF